MQDCNRYCSAKKLLKIPSYYAIFFKYREDHTVTGLRDRLDDIINELHNSRDAAIIGALNEMPVLYANAHTRPFDSKRNNMIAGIIFPAGIILWIRIWMFRIRLYQDLGQVQKQGAFIIKRIKNNTNNGQGNQA